MTDENTTPAAAPVELTDDTVLEEPAGGWFDPEIPPGFTFPPASGGTP